LGLSRPSEADNSHNAEASSSEIRQKWEARFVADHFPNCSPNFAVHRVDDANLQQSRGIERGEREGGTGEAEVGAGGAAKAISAKEVMADSTPSPPGPLAKA